MVTGSTGFVGTHILDRIVANGWKATVVVRKETKSKHLRDLPAVNVEDEKEMARVLAETDYFFNVAGIISAPSRKVYMDGNWKFTKKMVALCLRYAKNIRRFLHISSLAAAGPSKDGKQVTEDMAPEPMSTYGLTKLYGELEVLASADDMRVTIVRPPVVFGPRDRGLLELFQVAKKGVFPIPVTARRVSMVYVEDLVDSIFSTLMIPKCARNVYYACFEKPYSYGELHGIIESSLGRKLKKVAVPGGVLVSAARVAELANEFAGIKSMFNVDKATEMSQRDWICSAKKLEADTGYASKGSAEAKIPETMRWYKENRWL